MVAVLWPVASPTGHRGGATVRQSLLCRSAECGAKRRVAGRLVADTCHHSPRRCSLASAFYRLAPHHSSRRTTLHAPHGRVAADTGRVVEKVWQSAADRSASRQGVHAPPQSDGREYRDVRRKQHCLAIGRGGGSTPAEGGVTPLPESGV